MQANKAEAAVEAMMETAPTPEPGIKKYLEQETVTTLDKTGTVVLKDPKDPATTIRKAALAMTMTPEKMKAAINIVKAQPGRLPKEQLIQRVMNQRGITRKQAKDLIRKTDETMAEQYLMNQLQHEEQTKLVQAVTDDKIKPMLAAIVRTMPYSGI